MFRDKEKSVLERFLFESPSWNEGYQDFINSFGKPIGWIYLLHNSSKNLIRLNRKGNCSFYAKSFNNQLSCASFLEKYFGQLVERKEDLKQFPNFYHCGFGRSGVVFALKHLGDLKGFLILCDIKKSEREVKSLLPLFNQFLQSEVELAYKSFELQNFYETVHPRALALSTIHSVHRVMASSLGLDQLLPRIGRLCAQVIKAKRCDIFLVDESRKYLIQKFTLDNTEHKRRLRIGYGMEGHVAETADFYITRNCIAVPFIEDDVVGVVVLRDKMGGTPFTKTDIEILKTLSEQAVIAIKNAQLFEETEQLTLGSIKTINELLELSFAGDNVHLPLFSEIAYQIGRDLGLSGYELTNLHRATFLIDTGQLGTPDRILHKKEKLTKQEFNEVKLHPTRGAAILQQISSLRPIIPIILHHHERWDGRGYPSRLKAEEIPIGARIVAVVDSFTAMLSKRPYRKMRSVSEAIEEVRANSGSQFDPKVVDSFLKVTQQPKVVELLKQSSQMRQKKGTLSRLRRGFYAKR